MATKDDNGCPVIYGVSHLDGVTPVRIRFGSAREMMVDDTTSIAFDPLIVQTQNNLTGYPLATGTSSSDDSTVLPWVVNADTGAVLISN